MPLFTGDYNSFQVAYESKEASFQVLATDTTTVTVITPKSANHTVYVQRIYFNVTTFAAHTLTFEDNANTPVPISVISVPATQPTATGTVTYIADFGPHGYPLTQGKNLQMVISAAGVAGVCNVDAYEKLTGTPAVGSSD